MADYHILADILTPTAAMTMISGMSVDRDVMNLNPTKLDDTLSSKIKYAYYTFSQQYIKYAY